MSILTAEQRAEFQNTLTQIETAASIASDALDADGNPPPEFYGNVREIQKRANRLHKVFEILT